jgi:carbon storage regulator CsrA
MRHKGEKILIGTGEDTVEIMICKIIKGQVHLGIDAPKHISVDREEIRKDKEK